MNHFFIQYIDAIMIIHEKQHIRTIYNINNAFARVTGFPTDQLIGQRLAAIQTQDANTLWELVDRLCTSMPEQAYDAYAECSLTVHNERQIFAELHIQKLEVMNEVHYTVKLVDRSEHKWIEEMLLKHHVVSSVVMKSGGLITSLRSYHSAIPYDRLNLFLKDRRDFAGSVRSRSIAQLLSVFAGESQSRPAYIYTHAF